MVECPLPLGCRFKEEARRDEGRKGVARGRTDRGRYTGCRGETEDSRYTGVTLPGNKYGNRRRRKNRSAYGFSLEIDDRTQHPSLCLHSGTTIAHRTPEHRYRSKNVTRFIRQIDFPAHEYTKYAGTSIALRFHSQLSRKLPYRGYSLDTPTRGS